MEIERRRGPSTYTLSFAGIIAVAGILAIDMATYNSVQNDILSLKRSNAEQEKINERLSRAPQLVSPEQMEALREYKRIHEFYRDNVNEPREKRCGN